jgi:hypothetical protein
MVVVILASAATGQLQQTGNGNIQFLLYFRCFLKNASVRPQACLAAASWYLAADVSL